MSRIAQAFDRAHAENRAAFVAYVCAGDPDFETSLAGCRALLASGVDVLELGVPFSDPMADGLTNQLAAQRALESGMTAARVFELVRRIREFSPHPGRHRPHGGRRRSPVQGFVKFGDQA